MNGTLFEAGVGAVAPTLHREDRCGFTLWSRWLGRCWKCQRRIVFEVRADEPRPSMQWHRSVVCECGAKVRCEIVNGVRNERVACNARCMGAVGPACECSCGGENHGGR